MNDGKICVSVCAATADEMISRIKRAEEFADIIELRFDCLEHLQLKNFLGEIKINRFSSKFLITFRPQEFGGRREISLSERRKFWEFISSFANAEYFDIEPDLQKKFAGLRINPRIVSFHNFTGLNNLENIFEELRETNSYIIKIAVQADDIADSIAVWKLLETAKKDDKKLIPIAMGEAGKWTRILGLAHGAPLTYAALDAGDETAPGQISARDLTEVYRVKQLNEQTEIYGIVGSPVAQSLSPFMQNAAFEFHNLDAIYIPLEVKNLDEFIRKFIAFETREVELNFKGFSVTIPHKQAIIKHLDYLDETAREIGAVNTVKIINGKLHGFNTDAHGFIEPLRNSYGDLKNAKAAILGAGGAARACVYALKKAGANVTIFARNIEKAKFSAGEFEVELRELRITNHELRFADFDIVVNATPLGMKGEFQTRTPAAASQIENVKLVYDLVYNPFETEFIKEARTANVPTLGGLSMLVAQGAKQFEIWTQMDAPASEMSAAALKRLK